MSQATHYSKLLLEAFENSLPIQWHDYVPELIHHQITKEHVHNLQDNLRDLFGSKAREDAISDLEAYSRNTGSIQTTGVGLASDFNTFVNLGLLLGTRVVLWDTVIVGTFFPDDGILSIDHAVNVAIELMLLKRAIDSGKVIMLPHPAFWLERCQKYFSAVSGIDGITPEFQGYLHSRALLDEGFELHPYTMSEASPHNGASKDIESSINLMDGSQGQFKKYEISAKNLIFDIDFEYVKNIDSYKLSEFLSQNDTWRLDLHKRLLVPDYIETTNDLVNHLDSVKETIKDGIRIHNSNMQSKSHDLRQAKLGATAASFSLVAGTIGLATAGTPLTVLGAGIGVLGGGVASIPAFLALSKIIGDTDSEAVNLYQGFTILKDHAEKS